MHILLYKEIMGFPHSNVILHDVLQQLLGGVDGDMLASLAPPVHLSGERLGWTLLVCMVSDFRKGRLQISWRSVSEGRISILPYSSATNRNHHGHSAVAAITVATRDWPSYSCSVSHRRRPKVIKRHRSTSPGRHVAEHIFLKMICLYVYINILYYKLYHFR